MQALRAVGAARALGHHWGTFHLTNEGVEQPMLDLAAARAERGIAAERFSGAAARRGQHLLGVSESRVALRLGDHLRRRRLREQDAGDDQHQRDQVVHRERLAE